MRRGLQGGQLTTVDVSAQALAVGPVFAIGFAGFLVAGRAGSAIVLVLLITAAGALGLTWAVALHARRAAGAGSIYHLIGLVHGRRLAVVMGGLYFVGGLVTFPLFLVTGLLWQQFAAEQLSIDIGWWTGAVATLIFVAVVLWLGIRPATRTMLAFSLVAIAPFVVLAVTIIVKGGASGNTLSVLDPGASGAGDVPRALLYAGLLFTGFEAAAALGEEAREPLRTIPRAMVTVVAIAAMFYLLVAYAVVIGIGPDNTASAWGSTPFAVVGLGDHYVGRPFTALLELGLLIDVTAVVLAFSSLSARGYYALARDGLLPAPVARVSARATPVGGIVLAIVTGALPVLAAAFVDAKLDVFTVCATAAPFTFLPGYIVLALGALRLIGAGPLRPARVLAVLAGAAVPVLSLYGIFVPFPTGPARSGLILAGLMLAGTAVWAVVYALPRLRLDARTAPLASSAGAH